MTGTVAEKVNKAVEATLRHIAEADATVADIVRQQLGPENTWNQQTVAKALALALQNTDGRAG